MRQVRVVDQIFFLALSLSTIVNAQKWYSIRPVFEFPKAATGEQPYRKRHSSILELYTLGTKLTDVIPALYSILQSKSSKSNITSKGAKQQ